MVNSNKNLQSEHCAELFKILKKRFEQNMNRHKGLVWAEIQKKLESDTEKLWSLNEMEKTGGEPDIIDYDQKSEKYIFCDCSAESPIGRRSLCYDQEALESRKKHKPENNVINMVESMGIDLLTEEEYGKLQILENFDIKTSSWIYTPPEIRSLGGALFADYRFGRVFVYHNGAESYYASRGFRGMFRL